MADPRDITGPHATALATLLEASGYELHVVEVAADPAYPYLVLHPQPGTALAASIARDGDTHHLWRWQVTATGRDWFETAAALDRARAALVDQVLSVAGRGYDPISEDPTGQPIRQDPQSRDPSTGRPVFYGIAQFSALSVPA